jgi:hypothetical protein
MAIIRRKTKKKIGKQVKKLVKQHGPEVALGAATALVTTLINKATDKPAKKDKGEKDKGKKDKKAKASSKGDGKKGKKAQAES